MGNVKPVPDGYHTITPYIVVKGIDEALNFYQKAFDAEKIHVALMPDGKTVMHAEMQIGDSRIMMNDEWPQSNMLSPSSIGNSPVTLHLYVEDVDKIFQQAVDAGCQVGFPLEDTFWGDRYGLLIDPYGHKWSVATHKEDLTPEEMEKRSNEYFSRMGDHGEGN
ncbi:MAG TPA: VOC family protein [bacterium]|jgi:PhnB protein